MQTAIKALLVGAILAIGTSAASAADAVIGTWQLNVAKSTFSPGPAPKGQTRSYAESPQGVVLTTKTVAADGKESTLSLTFKADGKPYAVSGSPDFDTVSVKRVDALTVNSTQMKAGVIVGTGVRTVSKDGKTLTFAQKGTHAGGGKYDDMLVTTDSSNRLSNTVLAARCASLLRGAQLLPIDGSRTPGGLSPTSAFRPDDV